MTPEMSKMGSEGYLFCMTSATSSAPFRDSPTMEGAINKPCRQIIAIEGEQ